MTKKSYDNVTEPSECLGYYWSKAATGGVL